MAQLSGTIDRSPSRVPALVSGVLLAIAILATASIVALSVEGIIRTPAQPGALSYDGRLDPIEQDYIQRSRLEHPGRPAIRTTPSAVGRIDWTWPTSEVPRLQSVPR